MTFLVGCQICIQTVLFINAKKSDERQLLKTFNINGLNRKLKCSNLSLL